MTDNNPALDDFNEEDDVAPQTTNISSVNQGSYSASTVGGFKDYCLKQELTRAIQENGFEHPSDVQHQALPQALLGSDILAQAKAGMGKTAVFVFTLLSECEAPKEGQPKKVQAIVVVHARELAYQVEREFKRFNRYLPHCTTAVFFGGVDEQENIKTLQKDVPAIVVGTPGRLKSLVEKKKLDASSVRWFVCDEFDRCLADMKMRRDVQTVFMACPKDKQVMMFSATMTPELHETARKFMRTPTEILVDAQSKLTLHGLTQFFVSLEEAQKLRQLVDLLDAIEFNQVIIFTSAVERCIALNMKLQECKFPSAAIHSAMTQSERLKIYDSCKNNSTRIIVATDLFGRGIDIDRINLVIQFDMASDPDSYLHRVGRAGRFGTKGLTVAFVTDEEHELKREQRKYKDTQILAEVQSRFELEVKQLTNIVEQINPSQYMNQ